MTVKLKPKAQRWCTLGHVGSAAFHYQLCGKEDLAFNDNLPQIHYPKTKKKVTSYGGRSFYFFQMSPSFVRRYGQRLLIFVTTLYLVVVGGLSEVGSAARNDNATDTLLYDGRLQWNDYRYLEGLPLEQLLLLQRKVSELGNSLLFNTTNEPEAETRQMPDGDGDKNDRRNVFALPLQMQTTADR